MSDKNNKEKRTLLVAKLKNAINRLPGLTESIQEQEIGMDVINSIHVFAYGSLISDPHYEPTSSERGYLWGFSRDFCCLSIRSGAQEFTGLTLGLNDDEQGIVPGKILSYENMSLEEITEMLTLYADREATSTGIYKFEMLEVETETGKKVFALTCVANNKSEGYVNDSLSRRARKNVKEEDRKELSLWRKASIIAQADGPAGTNKSYLDRYVRYDIQKNPIVFDEKEHGQLLKHEQERIKAMQMDQERMKELLKAVDDFRDLMPPQETVRLEQVEQRQWSEFVKRQEQALNPPSDSLLKRLQKQLGFK